MQWNTLLYYPTIHANTLQYNYIEDNAMQQSTKQRDARALIEGPTLPELRVIQRWHSQRAETQMAQIAHTPVHNAPSPQVAEADSAFRNAKGRVSSLVLPWS